MELVYSIDFSSRKNTKEYLHDEKNCCSLSSKNIFAFSKAKKSEHDNDKLNTSYEVCVLDLDKPWLKYEVTSCTSPVTCMRWDPAGSTLLLVTAQGRFGVWRMQDSLLNMWEEKGFAELDKEEILCLAWLHNGIQTILNPESKDSINYSDKFMRAKMSSSVTQFGKKPVDGWMAITSTGTVHVGLLPETSTGMITCQTSLGQLHSHLAYADVAFLPDGHILVATSDGHLNSAVHCHVIALKLMNNVCNIWCNPAASFYLKRQGQVDSSQDQQTLKLSWLNFLSRENPDVLLAGWGNHSFSCIEVWHLMEQTVPLNRMFQNPSVTELPYKSKRWIFKSSFTHRSGLTDIARPKLPISRLFNMESSNFQSYFACFYRDGTIKIVHRQGYQVLYSTSLDQLIHFKSILSQDLSDPSEKRGRMTSPHLVSAVQTNTGCGIVGLGEGRLYLFRVFNSREGLLQMMPAYVVLLLEYVLNVGLDVWDVLLAVRQGMIEGIAEMLSANFQKQSGVHQDLLHQRMLRLKMALYSCQGPGNQRAADIRAMITLQAIATLIRTGLRPKAIVAQDKSPYEKLNVLCTNSTEMDVDQFILKNLDQDEFSPEAMLSSQLLQPHFQWIVDLVLHLLSSITNPGTYPGVTLMKNPQVLGSLRELLIIIRNWGKLNAACLPTFVKMVNVDILQILYKLVTKAYLSLRDGASMEADKPFMEECYSLPSKVLIPGYRKTFGEDMNCYLAFSQPFPINHTFGQEPDFLFHPRTSSKLYPFDACNDNQQNYDCVRQIYLGVNPKEPMRECVRCKSISLRRKPELTKSPMLRSWELRHIQSCLCGGHWKLRDLGEETDK